MLIKEENASVPLNDAWTLPACMHSMKHCCLVPCPALFRGKVYIPNHCWDTWVDNAQQQHGTAIAMDGWTELNQIQEIMRTSQQVYIYLYREMVSCWDLFFEDPIHRDCPVGLLISQTVMVTWILCMCTRYSQAEIPRIPRDWGFNFNK